MTKQEAIEQLEVIRTNVKTKLLSRGCWIESAERKAISNQINALDMAIKALEQQEEICYCKDCLLKADDGHCTEHSAGVDWMVFVKDTDYCSWGERGVAQND